MKRAFLLLIAALAAFSTQSVSFAGTISASNKTTATLAATCQLSVQNINFGTYNPNTGDVFAAGQINYQCTKNTNVTVQLNEQSGGWTCTNKYCFAGANGQVGGRILSSTTGDKLLYNLFSSTSYSASTMLQGSNYGGGTAGTFKADGTNQVMPIYGALAGGQWVSPGIYQETVTAIFNF
ncbi:spore coat protein U domain-containing protein [Burkholderia multivorans]|uniref:spore coat protein U domain-containing protein n=1 Tax=Burkholderia multivorans TaxID=87883 RepID=UPI0021C060E7|nr:spore coat protein U domain-containing protein [Burkholderia multivorans]